MKENIKVVIVIILTCLVCFKCSVSKEERERRIAESTRLQDELPVCPGLNFKKRESAQRSYKDSVCRFFESEVDYDTVKSFYMKNLPEYGWEFIKEEKYKPWGRDHGDRTLIFKKEDYDLEIYYRKPEPVYEGDCMIYVTWRHW